MDLHHFYAGPDAVPNSTYHPAADPDTDPSFQILADPAHHFDADPDPDFYMIQIRMRIRIFI